MYIKSEFFVVSIICIGFVCCSIQNNVRDSVINRYDGKLSNFGETLDYVNQLSDSEKLTGLHALVEVMKENDDLYTSEMAQLALHLKEFVNESKLLSAEVSEQVKKTQTLLPASLQNLTSCSKLRFYQTYLKGYLYADFKLTWNQERRYTFADGDTSHLASVWHLSFQGNYVFIINDFFVECFYPLDDDRGRYGLTWIPGISHCHSQMFWAFEPVLGTNSVRLRSPFFNQYLYLSDAAIEGKRRLMVANDSLHSYWEIHCAD